MEGISSCLFLSSLASLENEEEMGSIQTEETRERALKSEKTKFKFQLCNFGQCMKPLQASVSSSVKPRKYVCFF